MRDTDFQTRWRCRWYTLPPHTTKRRATNLKTKNNQNCQKIKLYGSPTTKELKKKHSSRPVGGAETGSWGREDSWQGSGWRSGRSHICKQINWNNCGVTQTTQPRVPVQGNKASKPLTEKNLWGLWLWEKLPVTQKSLLERPTGS